MSLFDELIVYDGGEPRAAALNMAVDEALLESVSVPTIRFYRWRRPSLSFGYFGRYIDVAPHESEREIVRRWTGGGTVFHGSDLTYSLIIPAGDPLFSESSTSIYQKIHRALSDALAANGEPAELATVAAVADRRYNAHECFANPVRADVLVNGNKIAGAAQRRTRAGLLQQGSIQNVDLARDFDETFARSLCQRPIPQELNDAIVERAREIALQKYGTTEWLRRR